MYPPRPHRVKAKQRGIALMIMLVIMVVGATTVLVNSLTSSTVQTARQETTAAALAQAKDALIGYAITYGDTHPIANPSHVHGYLPCPDLNGNLSSNPEGSSETCGGMGANTIGRLPWKTLGLSPLRDGDGECLWYVVSGTYKNNPKTDLMNWDTQGLFEILDANGATVAQNVVAAVFAPGVVLNNQNRAADGSAPICGGNYTPLNYLDNDTAAQGNTTAHGINNDAITVGKFIQPHYHPSNIPPNAPDITINDQMIFITKDELFHRVSRRNDFSDQITELTNDPYFPTISSSNNDKGTDNIDCGALLPANQAFCTNWLDMLLLTKINPDAPITIDGALTTFDCKHVLIFGGQKTALQARQTVPHKNNPANYLEGANLAAFDVPNANSSNFDGRLSFDADNPSADVLVCLP